MKYQPRWKTDQTIIPPTPQELAEREACPACQEGRYHSQEEWKNHPRAGSGIQDGKTWERQSG